MNSYKIHLLNSNKVIEYRNDEMSLLEKLEQNGIRHEYQCRSGYCGSCRAKIKKGQVSYKQTPLAFVQKDEILLCYCRVESDLELEI